MILNMLAPPELRVRLPFKFDSKTMYNFIDQILDEQLKAKSPRITMDFAILRFVDPSAITVLCNLIEFLRKKGVRVQFSNYKFPTEGNKFLDDSGFFKQYVDKKAFPDSALRETTLPLQKVSHDRSHAWINDTFAQWISERVGLSQASFASIKVCLAEIFNNILDHSGEKVGCVFAQHYPQRKEVMLSISDFGVGIPFNVRKTLPNLTDAEAIGQAMIEGFTTKSTVRNQGAGLDILTRYIVIKNQGSIRVHSLKGSFQCVHNASGVRKVPNDQKISYPGTLVQITFRTNFLEEVAEKEEFEW